MLHRIKVEVTGHVLLEPETPSAAARPLLGFHGYAETATLQMDRLKVLSAMEGEPKRYALCAPEGMNRFYTRSGAVVAHWMTKSQREDAIASNIAFVDRILEMLREEKGLVQEPILFGFSQGAALCYRYALSGAYPVHALICLGSDLPPELESELAHLPPLLLCHGRNDQRVSPSEFDAAKQRLTAAGASFESLLFEGDHFPNEEAYAGMRSFLKHCEG